jgi:signal transduction histidine kinase
MSHELRTPLKAILGFTGTLLMRMPSALAEAQEQQLRTVQTAGPASRLPDRHDHRAALHRSARSAPDPHESH